MFYNGINVRKSRMRFWENMKTVLHQVVFGLVSYQENTSTFYIIMYKSKLLN